MTLPPMNYERRSKDGRVRSAKHRAWIRKHLCILWARQDCEGPIDCCHARTLSPEKIVGLGMKVGDEFTFSACRKHHRESERNEVKYFAAEGINIAEICLEFARKSPDKLIREAAKASR